jgi:hypothetical protein
MAVPPAAQQAALAVLHRRDADIPLSPQAPGIVDPTPDPEMVSLRPDEVAWHTHHAGSFPGRSILLSHHQLYTAVQAIGRPPATPSGGTQTARTDLDRPWVDTDLWRQLGPLFGENVAAWIWGHEHNLGIYADSYRPADWPADLGTDAATFRTLPKGRCCGHAAIPVNVSEHPYATTYPVPLIGADVQLAEVDGWYNRGFEIIDLAGAGTESEERHVPARCGVAEHIGGHSQNERLEDIEVPGKVDGRRGFGEASAAIGDGEDACLAPLRHSQQQIPPSDGERHQVFVLGVEWSAARLGPRLCHHHPGSTFVRRQAVQGRLWAHVIFS